MSDWLHDDEVLHIQVWEIYQGARCILAENGPLNTRVNTSPVNAVPDLFVSRNDSGGPELDYM